MTGKLPTALNDNGVAVYRLPLTDDGAPEPSGIGDYDLHRDWSLMYQNSVWFCQLRWIVVVVLCLAGGMALFPDVMLHYRLRLAPGWLWASAAILAVANGIYLQLLRQLSAQTRAGSLRTLLWSQIVVDLLVLTAVIHCLGSWDTYAPFAYLFHIILACIFFSRWTSLVVTAISVLLYFGLLWGERAGVLVHQSAFRDMAAPLAAAHDPGPWNWQLVFLLSIWITIWYLVSRIASQLRAREYQLAATNARLEASSQERARHMLQTTHQLKAPFAAIHANTQLLLGGYSGSLPEASRRLVERIAARARMLSQQIQEMLQLANLRSQAQSQHTVSLIQLHELLQAMVERFEPTATARGIQVESHLEPAQVRGVEDFVKMLCENLLSNAISYSHNDSAVQVSCSQEAGKGAQVTVRDSGIGIPSDKLPRIFDDYFRTSEATLHNRASSGLGLAIVRHVARNMRINVLVESAPGWGTRFSLDFPPNNGGAY